MPKTYFDGADTSRWNWLNALVSPGWAVVHDIVPSDMVAALRTDAQRQHEKGRLTLAGVGRADDLLIDRDIRRDKTRWLTREEGVQAEYLDLMEELRLIINRELFLGLFSYEAHYAVYEPGAYYARHMDAFKGARNRVLSTVLYLNHDWRADDGGELAVYGNEGDIEPTYLVTPEAGALAVFLSEDIPHAVLASKAQRYSIAGWFRVNDRAEAPVLQAPGIATVG